MRVALISLKMIVVLVLVRYLVVALVNKDQDQIPDQNHDQE